MELMLHLQCGKWEAAFHLLPFLKEITVGGPSTDLPIPGCPGNISILCRRTEEGYVFSAQEDALLDQEEPVKALPDRKSKFSVLGPDRQAVFSASAIAHVQDDIPCYDRYIDLEADREMTIGGKADSDIFIRHSLISSQAMRLNMKQNLLVVSPGKNVPMGVYVNTRRIQEDTPLYDGDFLFCPGFRAYWHNGQLLIPSADHVSIQTLHYTDEKEQNSHLTYPCINRTTRKLRDQNTQDIEILDPPTLPTPSKNNLLLTLLPALAMILITIFLRGSFGSGGSMILFSVASLSIGAITSIFTYMQGAKENKKKTQQRLDGYQQYIQQLEKQIIEARKEERDQLRALYIDPEQELRNVRDFSADLFDRSTGDADFLDLRLGYGTLRAARKISCKKHEIFEASDELFALPEKLAQKYAYIDGLPARIPLKDTNAIGIVGNEEKLREMLKITVLDLATRHYFDDVILYDFLSSAFLREAESFRFLPHLKNHRLDRRNIAHDEESQKTLVEDLYKELSDRESYQHLPEQTPWLVIYLFADDPSLMHHPLIKYVEKAAALHAVFIILSTHRELLPQGCSYQVLLASNAFSGVIFPMRANVPDQLFSYSPLDKKVLREVAQRLAPVYSGEINLATRLNTSETLYGMLGIQKTDQVDILSRWEKADTSTSLAAPLGASDGGGVLCLDLHETVHGPHGLVAGTTGSGKSQVLISYILSLASLYSPEDVSFCIIDFKGGDIVKHLRGLPHIVGSITNLEKREIDRSLKSINAEKNKRMRLFADPDINVSNISDYTRAYKAGRAKIPLPHLIVIVDEFAELKSQHPDFMNDLISIARVGRSLGIHMILCTQKPAGVVDGQIWGNSDFKLCLRVQTKEDSNEVLKSPLASQIREPGRGYLQVGRTNQFVLFQSGYSGASENSALQRLTFRIHQLNLSGKKSLAYRHSLPEGAKNENVSQCNALLARIIAAFQASGMKKPDALCLPPVPASLPYEEAPSSSPYAIPVGVYDDPDNQRILPLEIDISDRNTLIVGSGQMGKTNLLMTILRRLASTLTAEDAQVYIMDFNALALKTMENLSIIGGVVTTDEEEKLKNLFKLLRTEMANRKAQLMDAGVTTFTAYRESHSDMPAILVMIDNYAPFRELYEDKYGDELTSLLREGPAMGISFCITAQQASTLTYRRLFYFSRRIVLPLNEQSEYSSVLEGCRMVPLETPGRAIISVDKQFYEGQTYAAFDGETEAKKAENIRAFVLAHAHGPRARCIPNVPSLLTHAHIRENYADLLAPHLYPYGMDYSTVAPALLDLNDRFALAAVGADSREKARFLRFFMQYAMQLQKQNEAKVYILDDYRRGMKDYKAEAAFYTTDPSDAESVLDEITAELSDRLDQAKKREDGMPEGKTLIVVLNSPEAIKTISDNSLMLDQFNTIADRYRRMKIFFLFSCMENKAISYSSPDLLRFIRDDRKALLFEDINTIRAFDISLMLQRANSRPRMNNEAFLLVDEEITRIKLVDAAE